jgi:hypothetical protein
LVRRHRAGVVERKGASVFVVLRVGVRVELRERPSEPAVVKDLMIGLPPGFAPIEARTASLAPNSVAARSTSAGVAARPANVSRQTAMPSGSPSSRASARLSARRPPPVQH